MRLKLWLKNTKSGANQQEFNHKKSSKRLYFLLIWSIIDNNPVFYEYIY